MQFFEKGLFKVIGISILFSMVAWAHPKVHLQGSNIKAYWAGADRKPYEVCAGLRKGMDVHLLQRGTNYAKVRFGANAPSACREKVAWVPYKFLPDNLNPNASSQASVEDVQTEASRCVDGNCNTRSKSPTASLANLFSANYTPLVMVPDDDGSPQRMSNCTKFIQRDGTLGPYGKGVLQAISKVDPSGQCFAGGNIRFSSKVCPGYARMSSFERMKFWVYVFAAISHDEGGKKYGKRWEFCDSKARNMSDGVGGSDGLFQLEYAYWRRRDSGRNSRFCPHTPIDSQNLTFQFQCAASIFKDVNCNSRSSRVVGNGTVFWSKLQRPDRVISRMIREYPGCR